MKLARVGILLARVVILGMYFTLSAFSVAAIIQEPYVMIKKPTTSLELVQNTKFAFDNGFLLQREFYTDENLMRFFGGKSVTWRVANDPRRQWVFVSNFDKVINTVTMAGQVMDGATLAIERTEQANGRVKSHVYLYFRSEDDRLTFENIEQIFGVNWQAPPAPQSPHAAPQSPTHIRGNAHIEYKTINSEINRIVDLKFSPNGNLEAANFTVEK